MTHDRPSTNRNQVAPAYPEPVKQFWGAVGVLIGVLVGALEVGWLSVAVVGAAMIVVLLQIRKLSSEAND